MISKKFINFVINILFFIFLSLSLNQCGIWDPADARKVPVNAKDRVQKNIEEYRIRQQKNFQNRQNSLASSLSIRRGQESVNKTSKKDQNRRKNNPPPKRRRQQPLF